MKNQKKYLLILILSFLGLNVHPSGTEPDETNKMILAALSAGNSNDLAKYFSEMIDLGITGTEDTYSKNQAARILQDFFTKNPVKSVKMLKQGFSNDKSQFTIGEMQAGTKTYRIYYLLKKVSALYLIQQFQIEETAQ
jgi:hypothetical protein